MRFVVVLLLALAVSSFAGATPRQGTHTLHDVEVAFFRVGLQFQEEWIANPYLAPSPNEDPRSLLPKRLRPRLIGSAGGSNRRTFKTWSVLVFDASGPASEFAKVQGRKQSQVPVSKIVVKRVGNVVYIGNRLPAAERALARLG